MSPEKTRAALARLRGQGRRTSRWAPYGWRFGPGGRLLPDRIADPPFHRGQHPVVGQRVKARLQVRVDATLRRIGALAAAGLSLREISSHLAGQGIRARNDKPFATFTLGLLVRDHVRRDKGLLAQARS